MKNVLNAFKTVTAGDLSANLTSPVTDIRYLDNIAIQLIFTGTPTGTFVVQGSLDYMRAFSEEARAVNAGTWTTITLGSTLAASGAAGNILVDLNQLSFPYIRVVYTRTSGTGSLDMWVEGKAV